MRVTAQRIVARLLVAAPLAVFCASVSVSGAGCGSSDSKADPAASDAAVAQIPMPTGDPLAWAVDERGPFRVGYRRWEISYLPAGQTAERTIGLNVWYPSLDAEGEPPKYVGLFTDDDVMEGASLAPSIWSDGTYPVHVHSHGSSGFGGTSSDMHHWFASHGWVVAAPDHTGNTLGSPEGKKPLSLYYLRSTDVTATLDALESLPAEDPLAGKLRTKAVVLSGHSFGCTTTWSTGGATFDVAKIRAKCEAGDFSGECTEPELAVFEKGVRDPRVVAGVPMANGASDLFGDAGYDAPTIPFLLMSGTKDVSGQSVFDLVTKVDLTWLEFEGGCHQLFALGGCPQLEEKLGWRLVATYAFAFARRYVLGDASGRTANILAGTEVLSDKVLHHKKGPVTPPATP